MNIFKNTEKLREKSDSIRKLFVFNIILRNWHQVASVQVSNDFITCVVASIYIFIKSDMNYNLLKFLRPVFDSFIEVDVIIISVLLLQPIDRPNYLFVINRSHLSPIRTVPTESSD